PEWCGDADSGAAALLDAVADRLIQLGGIDAGYIESFTDGYQEFRDSVRDSAANLPAQAKSEILKAAGLLAGRKIALVLGPDIFERECGESIFNAAFNLALATGGIGAENAGFFVPIAENNLAGSLDMGSAPDLLPGRCSIADDGARKAFERHWHTQLSPAPGLDLPEVIEAAEKGSLRGLYIMGENLARMLPDSTRVENAFKKLDFIVVQDIVHNSTIDLAHLVLPGAAFAEKAGSFTNMEGRIQAFSEVVAPPGNALPDWKILSLLAKKMGHVEHYDTVDEIRQEIRRAVPLYRNLGSHRREWLENAGAGTPFAPGGPKFSFIISKAPASTRPDEQYPFTALIGPLHWHAGGGTRTRRSARISSCVRHGNVEICPEDVRILGLTEKDGIRVESRAGAIERGYSIHHGLPRGRVFVPQGFQRNDVMNLVELEGLKWPYPGWRTCRVKISKIECRSHLDAT
ncbi:MAG: molybdopterin-dependent oxidoreductase, partial [Desulfatiglandaceae bacterium]